MNAVERMVAIMYGCDVNPCTKFVDVGCHRCAAERIAKILPELVEVDKKETTEIIRDMVTADNEWSYQDMAEAIANGNVIRVREGK